MKYVKQIRSDDGKRIDDAIGHASLAKRRIQIEKGLHPTQERHTLFHEWSHFVLTDCGLEHQFTEEQVEAICDAFATALVVTECQ